MKVDLQKVLEMLINEEQDQATGLLHQWFVEQSKAVHESIMQEEDGVLDGDKDQTQDIEDDQNAIESEEYYSEAEGDEDDADADVEADAGADDLEASLDGEAKDEEPEDLEDKVEDLQADLARLKAEFNALMGVEEPEHDMDFDGDGKIGDDADADADDSEEDVEADDEADADDADASDVEEQVEESEEADDFDDLDESFKLEPVADPALSGNKEIGKGAAVSVNAKSPIPQKKVTARQAGEPVVIKAEEHKGFALETSPEVKKQTLLKNQVKNAEQGRTPVSKEGDKAAMLNKKEGFGSDSPKSPVGPGAGKGK